MKQESLIDLREKSKRWALHAVFKIPRTLNQAAKIFREHRVGDYSFWVARDLDGMLRGLMRNGLVKHHGEHCGEKTFVTIL